MEYTVASSASPIELSDRVTDLMKLGWVLHGSVVVTSVALGPGSHSIKVVYAQALTRYKPKRPEDNCV